jgi:hypothetical protein
MSTKSPLSTICLVACANRASSRSIGGMLKKPGRKNSAPQTIRNATARVCEVATKSSTATRPRPGSARFAGSRPVPNRRCPNTSTMASHYDETAGATTA